MRIKFAHALRTATALLGLCVAGLSCNQALADEALAKKNGCTACHALSAKVMGPSFRSVSEKYAGNKDAVEALSASIRDGGSGRWGAIPMPPQSQLAPAAVNALASWIASGSK